HAIPGQEAGEAHVRPADVPFFVEDNPVDDRSKDPVDQGHKLTAAVEGVSLDAAMEGEETVEVGARGEGFVEDAAQAIGMPTLFREDQGATEAPDLIAQETHVATFVDDLAHQPGPNFRISRLSHPLVEKANGLQL